MRIAPPPECSPCKLWVARFLGIFCRRLGDPSPYTQVTDIYLVFTTEGDGEKITTIPPSIKPLTYVCTEIYI